MSYVYIYTKSRALTNPVVPPASQRTNSLSSNFFFRAAGALLEYRTGSYGTTLGRKRQSPPPPPTPFMHLRNACSNSFSTPLQEEKRENIHHVVFLLLACFLYWCNLHSPRHYRGVPSFKRLIRMYKL